MNRGAPPQVVVPVLCACGDHCFAPINGGLNVLVSPQDRQVLERRWSGSRNKRGYVGVARSAWIAPGTYKRIVLARVIMSAEPGFEVDPINGDTLDNRRGNLRVCLRKDNAKNRRAPRGRKNPKGVWVSQGRYLARIRCDGVLHCLGGFNTADEAHAAYCEAAARLHGEFARAA